MELAQHYLNHLMQYTSAGDDLFRLAAAYNGGPGNLIKWEKRMTERGIDVGDQLLFIEMLPAGETRLFIERVLANYWIYRMAEIEASLRGARLSGVSGDAREALPFAFDEVAGFRFDRALGGSGALLVEEMPPETEGRPAVFIIANSLGASCSQFAGREEAFGRAILGQISDLTIDEITSDREVVIGGLRGVEHDNVAPLLNAFVCSGLKRDDLIGGDDRAAALSASAGRRADRRR